MSDAEKKALVFVLKKFAHESDEEAQAHLVALGDVEAVAKDGLKLAEDVEDAKNPKPPELPKE